MAIVFRYFAFIAAAVVVINWSTSAARLKARRNGTAELDSAARALNWFWGLQLAFFLILGGLQFAGGYADPLFPFYEGGRTGLARAAWASVFALWAVVGIGLWRPGVAESLLAAGVVQGAPKSARTFRLFVTAVLLVNATAFGSLLLGLWGPITKPTF